MSPAGIGLEAQRRRVHAVAQTGRTRPIWEHVAQMGAAVAAPRLGAGHAVALVDLLLDCVGTERLEEARPARSGVELRLRREQRSLAADTHVRAVLVAVPVLAGERPLRSGPPSHLELLGGQALTPALVVLGELVVGGL